MGVNMDTYKTGVYKKPDKEKPLYGCFSICLICGQDLTGLVKCSPCPRCGGRCCE